MGEHVPRTGEDGEAPSEEEVLDLQSPDSGAVEGQAEEKTEAVQAFLDSQKDQELRLRPTAFRTNDGGAEAYQPPQVAIEYTEKPGDLSTLRAGELSDLLGTCNRKEIEYSNAMKKDPRWEDQYQMAIDHHEKLRSEVGDEIRSRQRSRKKASTLASKKPEEKPAGGFWSRVDAFMRSRQERNTTAELESDKPTRNPFLKAAREMHKANKKEKK